MPVIKSAAKRMRQETTRRARNRVSRDRLRVKTKELTAAVHSGDKKKIEKAHQSLTSELDKAVKKNLMHKNTVARRKQSAVRLVNPKTPKATPETPTKKTPLAKAKADSIPRATTKKVAPKKAKKT